MFDRVLNIPLSYMFLQGSEYTSTFIANNLSCFRFTHQGHIQNPDEHLR